MIFQAVIFVLSGSQSLRVCQDLSMFQRCRYIHGLVQTPRGLLIDCSVSSTVEANWKPNFQVVAEKVRMLDMQSCSPKGETRSWVSLFCAEPEGMVTGSVYALSSSHLFVLCSARGPMNAKFHQLPELGPLEASDYVASLTVGVLNV